MKKLLPILLFLLSCCHVALSQDYPVQVTTIVTPPYSLYLSDYASQESNTLQVMLQLKELDRPEYRVKLRITIEGQGISLRTKATFVPRAIVLQGGVPEMLTGADLSAYLNPNNIDFLGTTQQAFMRTGMFPEGFYTFKVEVLDYVRNVVVSNAGVGNAFIILNDPPLINLPFNNDKVVATDPQNIIFSWTPRHTASPNAAFSTEYEFTLVELYPENRNPNDAIRAANSIYTTTTSATSLNYGIIEPLLIPGRKYAFRIRAYDVSGKDLFKNNGYSEVNVFQFGDACVAPLNVIADPLDPVRIKFSWEQQDVHTSYSLEFRKEGTSTWEQQNVINDAVIVPGLQGNTTYEYRVQGQCGSIQGPFSTLATVITPASDTSAFVCGAPVPEIEINTTPLDRNLRLLDIIKTADFEVIITDLTANGDGSYKGTGRAMVPWFKLAGIRVKFSDIKVNQDLRVFSGNVTTIYSKDSRFVLSADLSSDDPEAPDTGSPTAPPAFNGMDTVLTVPITNVTIPTGNNTVIVVTTPTGQTFEIPRERNEDGTFRDTRITDANGDTWTVSSGGDIQRGPNVAPPPAYASRDSVNFRVNFAALENQYYGFDSKHFQEVAEDKININGEDYWIAWKSVESGRQDYVSATASGQTTFPAKVGFKTSNGPALHETGSSAAFRRVSVMGLVDQQVEALTAYVRVQEGQSIEEVQVGRLNVKAYDKVQKKVIVVPVNNASVPAASTISDELNKVYAQAVVGWEVVVEPSITVDETVIQNLDAGVSDMLSSFPENMLSFVRTFRNDVNRFIDGDAYYIFMVNNPNAGRAGFMPFNRKFGFVYTNKSTNVITTLAHELGHGAFNLRHTFSPEAMLVAEGTTDNLMDYNNGTKLKKYQWDLVRNQETINGWFESDQETELIVANFASIPSEFKNAGGTVSFFTPSLKVVTIPANTKSISISTLDPYFYVEAGTFAGKNAPIGSLISFKVGNNSYSYQNTGGNYKYYCETCLEGEKEYSDIYTHALRNEINKAVAGMPFYENEKIQLQLLQFDVSNDNFLAADANGRIKYFGDISEKLIVAENIDENAYLEADPTIPYFNLQYILQQPNDADVIAASTLSPFAKDFLNKFSAYTGRGKPFAPYVISSAFLVSKFEISENFFECNAALTYKRIAEGYKRLKIIRENLELGEYGTPMAPGTLARERNMAFMNAYFAFRALAIDPQTSAIEVIDINDKVSAANTAEKLVHLIQYTQECDLEKITIENRISAITILEPKNEEETIVKLVSSVNYNNQAGQLLEKLFANKSVLFRKIWSRLYDGGVFNQTFHDYINKVIEIDKTDNVGNTTTKTFSFERKKDQGGLNQYYSLSSTINNDGTVTIKYIFADNNSGRVLEEYNFESLDQWVKVKFPKENAFLYWTDPQEQDLEVDLPVYYIAYLIDSKETQQMLTAVRLLGNLSAILLAIPSGGSSITIVAGVSAGLATADLVVLFNEDWINDTEDGRAFLNAWQVITTIDAAAGGANLLKAIFKAAPGAITKIGFKFSELSDVLRTLPQSTKQQVLAKLREIPELLSRMNMEPVSRLFTNRILSEFEGVIIKSSFNSNRATLSFKNWIEGTIKIGNQESKIFEIGFTSNGGYCKFNDLRATANSSDEIVGQLDNVRYQQVNGSVGEGTFNIMKKSDGSVYAVKFTIVGRTSLLTKFNNYIHLKNWVDGLNDAADVTLITKLNDLPLGKYVKLNNYLNGADDAFKSTLKQPGRLDAWEFTDEAINNSSGFTQFARDPATLNKVTDMMKDGSTFRSKLGSGWRTKLSEILNKHKHLRCSTCSGVFDAGSEMHEFLADVEHFYTHFNVNGKGSKFFNWLNRQTAEAGDAADIATNPANTSLAEMYQTIHELRRRNLRETDVSQFGSNYSKLPDSRQSDFLLEDGTHIELKNKKYTSGLTPTAQEIDQIIGAKGAFGNIDNLNQFEWVASANRGNSITEIKTMWKTVFTDKKSDIFSAMKPELRSNLNLFSLDDLTSTKIDQILDIILKVE